MVQANAVFTEISFFCVMQCFISAVSNWGAKCDKVVDFAKSVYSLCDQLINTLYVA